MCMCMPRNLTVARTLLCSIWTIDLAHLLRRFGMEVVFCTITLGANPAFSSEAFYAENMPEDEARVQQLFNVSMPSTLIHLLRCVGCLHVLHNGLGRTVALWSSCCEGCVTALCRQDDQTPAESMSSFLMLKLTSTTASLRTHRWRAFQCTSARWTGAR